MEQTVYGRNYDVVVAGGGVSGSVAAIAAGRCGASVLVIEQSGYLGGTLTGCGVGPMMTFHAGEKQVIRGIMQDIVDELVKRGYSVGHVKDTTQYISYLTPFSSEGLKLVLDEMVTGAGCDVLFHTFVGGTETKDDRITGLRVCNKDGIHTVAGKVIIDATSDGDVAAFSGARMTKGREEDGASQPMTMNMKYCNVDTDALKEYVYQHLEEFPRLKDHLDLIQSSKPFAVAGFDEVFKKAKEKGEISIPREDILFFETSRKNEYIINTTRILDHDSTDAVSLSDAEFAGRRQCAELDTFLRKYVPGFRNALLEFTGPSVGVRGSRQLVGRYTLTADDIIFRKKFDSVIVHSAYPIDIHNPKGEGTDTTFMGEFGTYYHIPYEIMVCDEIRNLLVTGRCVSASFEAQAAIRTTPTVGALGHAGGIAAAMAARNDSDTRKIDVKALQDRLKKQGAYLEI
ncbi:MAG: FAD-dependent oxidoreductase [Ruminococcaceae bacterium]|nr:FAD-dependent oxidoreductase [Oscillospiraceae bacterium]